MEWWHVALSVLGGTLIPIALLKFIPNSTFHNWGISVGSKLSSEGGKFIGKKAWENLENSIAGSFIAFSDGLKEGFDKDDEVKR